MLSGADRSSRKSPVLHLTFLTYLCDCSAAWWTASDTLDARKTRDQRSDQREERRHLRSRHSLRLPFFLWEVTWTVKTGSRANPCDSNTLRLYLGSRTHTHTHTQSPAPVSSSVQRGHPCKTARRETGSTREQAGALPLFCLQQSLQRKPNRDATESADVPSSTYVYLKVISIREWLVLFKCLWAKTGNHQLQNCALRFLVHLCLRSWLKLAVEQWSSGAVERPTFLWWLNPMLQWRGTSLINIRPASHSLSHQIKLSWLSLLLQMSPSAPAAEPPPLTRLTTGRPHGKLTLSQFNNTKKLCNTITQNISNSVFLVHCIAVCSAIVHNDFTVHADRPQSFRCSCAVSHPDSHRTLSPSSVENPQVLFVRPPATTTTTNWRQTTQPIPMCVTAGDYHLPPFTFVWLCPESKSSLDEFNNFGSRWCQQGKMAEIFWPHVCESIASILFRYEQWVSCWSCALTTDTQHPNSHEWCSLFLKLCNVRVVRTHTDTHTDTWPWYNLYNELRSQPEQHTGGGPETDIKSSVLLIHSLSFSSLKNQLCEAPSHVHLSGCCVLTGKLCSMCVGRTLTQIHDQSSDSEQNKWFLCFSLLCLQNASFPPAVTVEFTPTKHVLRPFSCCHIIL